MRRAGKNALGILAALLVVVLIAFCLLQTGFRPPADPRADRRPTLRSARAPSEAQALEGFVPFDMTLVAPSFPTRKASGSKPTVSRRMVTLRPARRHGFCQRPLRRPHRRSACADLAAVATGQRTDQARTAAPCRSISIFSTSRSNDWNWDLGSSVSPPSLRSRHKRSWGDPTKGLQAKLDLNRTDRDLDRSASRSTIAPRRTASRSMSKPKSRKAACSPS